jgi:hypothetical protein
VKSSVRPRSWLPPKSAFAGFRFPPEVIVVVEFRTEHNGIGKVGDIDSIVGDNQVVERRLTDRPSRGRTVSEEPARRAVDIERSGAGDEDPAGFVGMHAERGLAPRVAGRGEEPHLRVPHTALYTAPVAELVT